MTLRIKSYCGEEKMKIYHGMQVIVEEQFALDYNCKNMIAAWKFETQALIRINEKLRESSYRIDEAHVCFLRAQNN